ncbi:MAG: ABC transporter substrate-binding protein [Phycisphaerales bacterium]|nr:MAG: ABC transporter substrate-binding protein [Phycisphaerales bacterium]
MRKVLGTMTLLALSAAALAADTRAKARGSRDVRFDARAHQTQYAGPGRDEAPPDVKEVLMGYFGPSEANHMRGGDMWRAARLAIEKANQEGGYKGVPFRLVAGWSENPWSSGVREVTRMAYEQEVWAIIGGIDGPSTHLAEQVVAKARLTLLSPASTDKTVNLANVPWMFSCLPADHIQAPVLAEAIASHTAGEPFLLVSATDHDSHLFTVELAKSLSRLRLAALNHFEVSPKDRDLTELVRIIARTEAGALVLIAGADRSARIVSAIRKAGFAGRIFGGPWMGQRSFLEKVDEAGEGAVFPLLSVPSKESLGFENEFRTRYGHDPDYLAAHTYDAVNLLIAAVRKVGLNRARICDMVRELSPYQGITGRIRWDPLGSNERAVDLGTIEKGRIRALSPKKPCSAHRDLGAVLPSTR